MLMRNVILGVITAAVLCVLITTGASTTLRAGADVSDFSTIYNTSRWALEHRTLDDPRALRFYPPSARPILMLFALVPRPAAAVFWWAISAALHFLCLFLIVKYMLPGKAADPLLLGAVSYLALIPWAVSDLSAGNLSPVVLAGIVVSYFFYRRERPIAAGIALGVGVAVKLAPVFLLFFYVVKRRGKAALMSGLCTVLIGTIPGVLLVGPRDFLKSWKTWHTTAVKMCSAEYAITGERAPYREQSLAYVMVRLLNPISAGRHDKPFYVNVANLSRPTILTLWYALVIITFLAWIFLIRPRRFDPPSIEYVHLALVTLAVVWFSPHVLSYYLIIPMPAVVLLIYALGEKEGVFAPLRIPLAIILGLYIVGCFSPASHYLRALGSYQFVVLVLAVAMILIARELRRAPRQPALTDGPPGTQP